MYRAVLFSILLHIAVGLFATLEYSWQTPKPLINRGAIEVSLAALPPVEPKPKPKPAKKLQPKPVEKPKVEPAPTPKPKPIVPPKPKTVAAPPKPPEPKIAPQLKPRAVEAPKPKAEPESAQEPAPTTVVRAPEPRKPQQPSLQSLLKDISEEEVPPETQIASVDTEEEQNVEELLKDIVEEDPTAEEFAVQQGLSNDDIQRLRAQLAGCWNFPAGAKGAENLSVKVKVITDPDGSVRRTTLIDQQENSDNSYYTIVAEAALRALRHPACQKLDLPLDKHAEWQDITLTFDPKDLL